MNRKRVKVCHLSILKIGGASCYYFTDLCRLDRTEVFYDVGAKHMRGCVLLFCVGNVSSFIIRLHEYSWPCLPHV